MLICDHLSSGTHRQPIPQDPVTAILLQRTRHRAFAVASIETQRFDRALSWPLVSGGAEAPGLGRHRALLPRDAGPASSRTLADEQPSLVLLVRRDSAASLTSRAASASMQQRSGGALPLALWSIASR